MTQMLSDNAPHAMIGQIVETGPWFAIDQSRIDLFAEATEDYQYIHTDPERAKQTALRGTIAHGFLSLSMLSKLFKPGNPLMDNIATTINYGFNKVRFLNMVRPGDHIRLVATVSDVQDKGPGQALITMDCVVEIKGKSKPAIVCEWLNLFIREGA